MTAELITQLVINIGLAGALVIFFVIEGKKREANYSARLTQLEEFQKTELLSLVRANQEVLTRSNHIMQQVVSIMSSVRDTLT